MRFAILIPLTALAVITLAAQEPPPGQTQSQAQEPPPGQAATQDDAPTRAARLGLITGTVSFQPGGVDEWVQATPNRPMTTGDRLWADTGGRAELNLGSATFRLNEGTNFSFLNLGDSIAQVQISMGVLGIHLHDLAQNETVEIDTPQLAFTLLRPGNYRVEVSPQGDATIVTVRGGDAEITAGGQAFPVHARDQVQVTGDGQAGFDRRPMPPGDGFDNWCDMRDMREDRSPSARYVSRDMPGYADLDGAGVWRETPGYGMVWSPNAVPVGWAPYHNGHWAWIDPWGWTWVDDAPWGYAPFHYGRWAFVGGGWGWIPGPVVVGVRPVYAPALVAWVGGPGFGVGIGVGGGVAAVGWFPLGPREVFVPGYHYSAGYIANVNVTNTVIVNRAVFNNVSVTNVTYVNRGVAGAVTAVPGNAMVAGRPVAAVAVRVPPGAVERAQVSSYAAVAPQREAVLGGRTAAAAGPPAAAMNRPVVARMAPPPRPAPFAARQAALAASPGRPLDRSQMQSIQQSHPAPQPMVREAGVPARVNAGSPAAGGRSAPAVTPPAAYPRGGERPLSTSTPPAATMPRNTGRPAVEGRTTPPANPRTVEPRNEGARRPSDTKKPAKTKNEKTEKHEHDRF